jgi:hypothetical protein
VVLPDLKPIKRSNIERAEDGNNNGDNSELHPHNVMHCSSGSLHEEILCTNSPVGCGAKTGHYDRTTWICHKEKYSASLVISHAVVLLICVSTVFYAQQLSIVKL